MKAYKGKHFEHVWGKGRVRNIVKNEQHPIFGQILWKSVYSKPSSYRISCFSANSASLRIDHYKLVSQQEKRAQDVLDSLYKQYHPQSGINFMCNLFNFNYMKHIKGSMIWS